jgi:hypothetical protein
VDLGPSERQDQRTSVRDDTQALNPAQRQRRDPSAAQPATAYGADAGVRDALQLRECGAHRGGNTVGHIRPDVSAMAGNVTHERRGHV